MCFAIRFVNIHHSLYKITLRILIFQNEVLAKMEAIIYDKNRYTTGGDSIGKDAV